MRKNVGGARAQVTVALSEVSHEQILEEFLGESIKVRGIPDLSSDDLRRSMLRCPNWLTFSYSFIGFPSSVKNGG